MSVIHDAESEQVKADLRADSLVYFETRDASQEAQDALISTMVRARRLNLSQTTIADACDCTDVQPPRTAVKIHRWSLHHTRVSQFLAKARRRVDAKA